MWFDQRWPFVFFAYFYLFIYLFIRHLFWQYTTTHTVLALQVLCWRQQLIIFQKNPKSFFFFFNVHRPNSKCTQLQGVRSHDMDGSLIITCRRKRKNKTHIFLVDVSFMGTSGWMRVAIISVSISLATSHAVTSLVFPNFVCVIYFIWEFVKKGVVKQWDEEGKREKMYKRLKAMSTSRLGGKLQVLATKVDHVYQQSHVLKDDYNSAIPGSVFFFLLRIWYQPGWWSSHFIFCKVV